MVQAFVWAWISWSLFFSSPRVFLSDSSLARVVSISASNWTSIFALVNSSRTFKRPKADSRLLFAFSTENCSASI